MSLQLILIIGLVLAALIYFRKGMRAKRWYTFIAAALSLPLLGFFGVLLNAQWALATIVIIGGTLNIVYAIQWRPQVAQGNEYSMES